MKHNDFNRFKIFKINTNRINNNTNFFITGHLLKIIIFNHNNINITQYLRSSRKIKVLQRKQNKSFNI